MNTLQIKEIVRLAIEGQVAAPEHTPRLFLELHGHCPIAKEGTRAVHLCLLVQYSIAFIYVVDSVLLKCEAVDTHRGGEAYNLRFFNYEIPFKGAT